MAIDTDLQLYDDHLKGLCNPDECEFCAAADDVEPASLDEIDMEVLEEDE